MSLALYKPNSKNTGCAFNFSIGNDKKKEPVVYANAIQQFSWDEKKRTGNFSGNASDPDKKINLKFTEFEIGGMISAFKKRNEFSSYHAYEDNKTTIKCVPWDKKSKVRNGDKEEWVTLPAFGITFTRNGNQSFRIPLEPGEVENLCEFFKFYLNTLYSHRRKEELKKAKDYKSQRTNTQETKEATPSEDDAPF
jgi:hypothetical protein